MKTSLHIIQAIGILVFWGCQQSRGVVATLATETPMPTLVYGYRTFPKETLQPTITAVPTIFSTRTFPDGFAIEEYKVASKNDPHISDSVYDRHPNSGGVYFFPQGGLLNGKLFQATEQIFDNKYAKIHATLDGTEIAVIDCGQVSPTRALITAWTYDTHWIAQTMCHGKFDVFWDGESLNTRRGYQSSFAFQLIGGEPFYLFERDNQIWFFYKGEEVLLQYDDVKLTYCCETYRPPQHYENMITFYATRDDQLYYVAIGLFGN